MQAPVTRTRRSSEEVRALVLDAARAVFSECGYDGATTKEIAIRAGIAEPLIFRHFGTKSELFSRAVFEPFEEFVHGYIALARAELAAADRIRPSGNPELARAYIVGLYEHMCAHRAMFVALLRATGDSHLAVHPADPSDLLSRLFDELEEIASAGLRSIGYTRTDVALVVRFTFGLVLSVTVLDDWIFPRGRRRPARKRVVDELVAYVMTGVMRGPPR